MDSYLKGKSMYITLGVVVVGVLSYIAITDVFDFKNRGREEDRQNH